MIRDRITDLKGSLKGLFTRLMAGGEKPDSGAEFYQVDRQDLRAFIANEPIADWHRQMTNATLAHRWEECARTLGGGVHMLGEKEKPQEASNAVNAMNRIAGIIRESGNFDRTMSIPKEDIEALANARDPLHTLKYRLFKPNAARNDPAAPGNIDTLYFKAEPIFVPYTGQNTMTIPKATLEGIITPVLADMGINPKDKDAAAQGWNKLGELITDLNRYDFTHIDVSGPFLLRTHMMGMAIALCKTRPDEENVVLPKRLASNIEYTLHHMDNTITTLNRTSTSQRYLGRNQDLRDLKTLETAYKNIREQLAPWFAHPRQHPGNQYAFDD